MQFQSVQRSSKSPARRREAGNAYILTLMILALLTIMGVTVSLVTQTEILAGSQERSIERIFYAAESGLELSIGKALSDGNFGAAILLRKRTELEDGQLVNIQERVTSTPFFCLGDAPCNLCAINQGRDFVRRNHVLATQAARFGVGEGGVETDLARKGLGTMVDVEPSERTLACLADTPELGSTILTP